MRARYISGFAPLVRFSPFFFFLRRRDTFTTSAFHPFHFAGHLLSNVTRPSHAHESWHYTRENLWYICDIFSPKRSNKKWKNRTLAFSTTDIFFSPINVCLTVSGSTEVWVMAIRFTSESSIVWSMTRYCSALCETRIFGFVKQARNPNAFECLKICVLLKWDCDINNMSYILE